MRAPSQNPCMLNSLLRRNTFPEAQPSMNKLTTLQHSFQDFILRPHHASAIESSVVSDIKASAYSRLDIYATAYRMRLCETLEQDFAALHTFLGDEQFHTLCLHYLDAHPSQHFSLRYLGQRMSTFLRTQEFYARQPALAELAALEWAMADAFDAADSTPITPHDLAALAPELWGRLRFSAHPSVQQLDLAWNVAAIWSATHRNQDPPPSQRGEQALTWLVWRNDLKTWYRSLSVEEAWAWHAACAGLPFSEICDGLCRWFTEEEVPASAVGMLRQWISDGLVCKITQ